MADKNRNEPEQKGTQGSKQKPFKDLEARKEDTKNVKGGRATQISGDPCDGGE